MPLHPVRTTANTAAEHVDDHNAYRTEFDTPTHTHSGASVAPFVSVRRAAAQGITNSAYNLITFDTEVEDTDTMYDAGSPTIITIKTAGVYDLRGGIEMVLTPANTLFLVALNKSSAAGTNQIAATRQLSSTADSTASVVSRHYRLAVNDVISLQCYQASGATRNTVTGEQSMFLTAIKVRD